MDTADDTITVSARDILAQWANGQTNWVRHLVADILANGLPPDDEVFVAAFELLLREHQLKNDTYVLVPALAAGSRVQDSQDAVTLKRLSIGENINALVAGQEIVFGPTLTLIYGENGSGKSGVVRVLKRAANARAHEPVLRNVRVETKGVPSAQIEVEQAGQTKVIEWKDTIGVEPLTRLTIFDSRCIGLHVDEDLTYTYVPGELELFRLTQVAIERVRSLLDKDIHRTTPGTNTFVTTVDAASRLFPLLSTLGSTTDLTTLNALVALSADDTAELAMLPGEIETLATRDVESQLTVAKMRLDVAARSAAVLEVVDHLSLDEYRSAYAEMVVARDKAEYARREAFKGYDIPGVITQEWREFVQAAAEYRKAADIHNEYPAHGDQCIYCRQSLSDDTIELLRKYDVYATEQARGELSTALSRLLALVAPIKDFDIAKLLEDARRIEEMNDGDPLNDVVPFLVSSKALRDLMVAFSDVVIWDSKAQDLAAALAVVREEQKKLDEQIRLLTSEASTRQEAIATKRARLQELQTRRRVGQSIPEIETYVQSARWVARAETVNGQITVMLRTLTEASKAASESLLNKGFEQRFEEERQALRAPAVALDFPGRQGQVARRKIIGRTHRPGEVLSEGEQKVLALADFIAEARGKAAAGPIIFDDPITSLDHKRLGEVAQRVRILSETHQVIVFTHNIWFVLELLDLIEKGTCSFFRMWADEAQIGLISPSSSVRVDTIKSLTGKINNCIQRASATVDYDTRSEHIEKGYEYLRNVCEVIVEQDLLKGVAERYQPMVRITLLPKIRLGEFLMSAQTIERVYAKACRYIASHAQPLATLSVAPTVDELRQDWSDVQTAREPHIQK